jgi:hypothetical protein
MLDNKEMGGHQTEHHRRMAVEAPDNAAAIGGCEVLAGCEFVATTLGGNVQDGKARDSHSAAG